ncbi:hypothetical protein ABT336_13185 [Micromonospora sp. NPDC000207]|uniref:hypothetical protein n=1 Tax=Micromonospora sp. NPDC000207 TaxID=3154246 RepID=UPI003328F78B
MTLPLFPGAPETPRRFCLCGKPVPTGHLTEGWGSGCARKHGLTPPRIPRPRSEPQDGLSLFDTWEHLNEKTNPDQAELPLSNGRRAE